MSDYWATELAKFRRAPIQDIYGVVSGNISTASFTGDPDLSSVLISFNAWRVGDGVVNQTLLPLAIYGSEGELESLVGIRGLLRKHRVVHIKAHMYDHGVGHLSPVYSEWVGPIDDDAELNEIYRLLGPPVLDLPPLPPLQLDKYEGWKSTIVLPSWARFYPASEPFYRNELAHFPLSIAIEELPTTLRGIKGAPASPAQIAAYEYLVQNDVEVRDAVLQFIFEQYPQWQQEYGGDEEYMPDITEPLQLESLVALWSVRIEEGEKEGVAYVYFGLKPEWDPEHGLAAIVHKRRVVAVGDHGSMYKVIERDASE